MKKTLYLLLSMSILLIGCQKFEDGGYVRKTEKNLVKTWSLSEYLVNGVDKTSSIKIKNYSESYDDSGNYTRNYIDHKNEQEDEKGSWKFEKENKRLSISGVSSIYITDETGTISSSYFNILKLDDNEFWYSYENGSEIHEFHLKSK